MYLGGLFIASKPGGQVEKSNDFPTYRTGSITVFLSHMYLNYFTKKCNCAVILKRDILIAYRQGERWFVCLAFF